MSQVNEPRPKGHPTSRETLETLEDDPLPPLPTIPGNQDSLMTPLPLINSQDPRNLEQIRAGMEPNERPRDSYALRCIISLPFISTFSAFSLCFF